MNPQIEEWRQQVDVLANDVEQIKRRIRRKDETIEMKRHSL